MRFFGQKCRAIGMWYDLLAEELVTECPECGDGFETTKGVRKHIDKEHATDDTVSCVGFLSRDAIHKQIASELYGDEGKWRTVQRVVKASKLPELVSMVLSHRKEVSKRLTGSVRSHADWLETFRYEWEGTAFDPTSDTLHSLTVRECQEISAISLQVLTVSTLQSIGAISLQNATVATLQRIGAITLQETPVGSCSYPTRKTDFEESPMEKFQRLHRTTRCR